MTLRKVGPQGKVNVKPYLTEAAGTRGLCAKVGATEGNCTALTTAGGRAIGIYAENAAAGSPASIIRNGDAVAIAGSAGTQGQFVKANAAGQVIPVTGTAGGGEEVVGRLESSPLALGDECIVFVCPFIL